ncbi:hypothetical protein B0H14DRAFT_3140134 [Mycena olivaceomarginata]|nr:hypothetical protein B0H14DRAFT_3140134 [Mycena olivaceomarginata]
MPTEPTPAEKRKATLAAKAAKEQEEQIAFENKSKVAGGRQAKKDAKKNAVWNSDMPASRKRTLSTVAVSESAPAKKARDAVPDIASDAEERTPETQVVVKSKKSGSKSKARQHAPPDIDVDRDEPEQRAKPVAKKPAAKKSEKAGSAVKPVAPQPPKIVAESGSESSTSSDNESGSDSPSEEDDTNEQELLAESSPAASAKSKRPTGPVAISDNSNRSYEIDDVAAARRHKTGRKEPPAASELFDSDDGERRSKSFRQPVINVDSDSDSSMPDAPPRNTRVNVKIERMEVDMPPAGRHRRSSSASSWSSGRTLSVPSSENLSDVEVADSEPASDDNVAAKKPRKVSAARQQQADSEKPSVRRSTATPAAPGTRASDVVERTEASWHVTACLVLPAPGRNIGLTAQDPELQFVLCSAIASIKSDLFFVDMYPTISTRAGFARPHLIKAALIRVSSRHIHHRLVKDPDFAAALAPIPLDRINIIRGDFKKCAVACLAGHYHLADLDEGEVKRRVEDFLKDHRYIFPVDKRAGGKLQFDQPFAHPAIIHMLKELGFSKPSFVTEHLKLFPTIAEKPDERELPVPLLAIPATALYAGFVELRMTGSRQPTLFTEDAFEDTYRNHVAAIELNRRDAPKATHKLLHGLFNQVMANRNTADYSSGSAATLIQLADVPSD